jgi:phage-related protein
MAFEYLKTVDWIQLGKDVVTLVVNGVQNFFNKLPDKIREIGDTAHRWFKSIDWKQLGKDTITMIKDGIQFLFNDLPNLLRNIGTEAFQTVQSIDWLSLGEDIINGIINGVQNLAGALVDTVSSIASDAYDAVKDFFDIDSPSKKMIWIGEMVDKGLTKGIEDSADLVKDAMNDISVVPEVQTSAYDAGTAFGANSAASSETNNNNVTINVYGAVGQDMTELAEIIEQKITAATKRREGAFA